jgi:Ion channel
MGSSPSGPGLPSAVRVLSVNIDEWGSAVTSTVSFVCLFTAILMYAKHKRRIAAYLAIVAYILFFPVHLWFFQFELTARGSIGVTYIFEVVVIQLILTGVMPLVISCFFRFRPVVTGLLLAYVLSLLLQFFSYAYWAYGTKQNFNINLSHLDSFYFALGTLTTAGTGSISAISETSRGYQTLQMALDLMLVGFVIVVILARYVSLLSSRTEITAAEEIVTKQAPTKRVVVSALDVKSKAEPERTATPKPKQQHSDHCTW